MSGFPMSAGTAHKKERHVAKMIIPTTCFPTVPATVRLVRALDTLKDPEVVGQPNVDSSIFTVSQRDKLLSTPSVEIIRNDPKYDQNVLDNFVTIAKACSPVKKEFDAIRNQLKAKVEQGDRSKLEELQNAMITRDAMFRTCLAQRSCPRRWQALAACWQTTPRDIMEAAAMGDARIASLICKDEKESVELCAGRQVQHFIRSSLE